MSQNPPYEKAAVPPAATAIALDTALVTFALLARVLDAGMIVIYLATAFVVSMYD